MPHTPKFALLVRSSVGLSFYQISTWFYPYVLWVPIFISVAKLQAGSSRKRKMPFRRTSYFIWEFILAMLQEEECSSIISWTKESDLEFEIKDMAELAQLWGLLRGRPEMDKKSFFRAFRYYYKINVIKKVCSYSVIYSKSCMGYLILISSVCSFIVLRIYIWL